MEARYQTLPGVLDTEVGYTGGHLEDPTYRDVCQDDTGHVEAVKSSLTRHRSATVRSWKPFSAFMTQLCAKIIAAPKALSIAR